MGDWASDYDSALRLVDEATRQLWKLNLHHELLGYWFLIPGEETNPEKEAEIRKQFKDRFWNRPTPWQTEEGVIVSTVALTNYYLAIQEAITSHHG